MCRACSRRRCGWSGSGACRRTCRGCTTPCSPRPSRSTPINPPRHHPGCSSPDWTDRPARLADLAEAEPELSAADALALAARAGIHRLPIPTPFLVGRVNLYLLEDDPLTLVDTGPNSGKSLDELEQALAELGHRIEDLGLIVITHQHMDHLGLLEIIARRSGAEVAALDVLGPYLSDFSASAAADDEFSMAVMRRHGVPSELAGAL